MSHEYITLPIIEADDVLSAGGSYEKILVTYQIPKQGLAQLFKTFPIVFSGKNIFCGESCSLSEY